MIPRTLSVVGILLILLALVGFALLFSKTPARAASNTFVFSGGDNEFIITNANVTLANGNANANFANVNANASNTNMYANANSSANANSAKPTPQPTPVPTPRPTAVPTPQPTSTPSSDEELKRAVEDNLERHGLKSVAVSVSNRVVTLGNVPRDKKDAAYQAVREINQNARVRLILRPARPADEVRPSGRPDRVAPPNRETQPPDVFIKIQKRETEHNKIEVEWPESIDLKDSGTFRVSILGEAEQASAPTTDIAGDQVTRLDPNHCNTPVASLRDAYGSQFEAIATAKLTSSGFDVQASSTDAQSLDNPRVTWQWDIKPKSGGSHDVQLTISVHWRNRKNNNQAKPACDILDKPFRISVEDSLFSGENMKTASEVVGLVGLVLQLPIFVWKRKKGKEEDKGDEKG